MGKGDGPVIGRPNDHGFDFDPDLRFLVWRLDFKEEQLQ